MTNRQRKRVKRYRAERRHCGRYAEEAMLGGRIEPADAPLVQVLWLNRLGVPGVTVEVGPYRPDALPVERPDGRALHVLGNRYTLQHAGGHMFSFVPAPEVFDV